VGKPEGKRPLGRPRRRWGDNIKMDLQEVGGGWEDWMELAQDKSGVSHTHVLLQKSNSLCCSLQYAKLVTLFQNSPYFNLPN